MSNIVKYEKQCKCRSTASGPRIVIQEQTSIGDSVHVTMTISAMACDNCNRPWKLMEEDKES